jgi:DNA-binding CsgD family transcriptional regulator
MAVQQVVRLMPFSELDARVVDYASRIDELQTPTNVLNELHDITSKTLRLSVLGAARFPQKAADWDSLRLGQSVFLHSAVPKGWWNEYQNLARGKFRPLLFVAQSRMEAYTWSEARRMLDLIGSERWSEDLFLKYGMRDGLTCPVGGRWAVTFSSRRELSKVLKKPVRNMLLAATGFAALRLEHLTDPHSIQKSTAVRLSPRELAVLRLVSTGARGPEVGQALGIGEETIRSHMKKAQIKLGARCRAHAVAEALRQNLIP